MMPEVNFRKSLCDLNHLALSVNRSMTESVRHGMLSKSFNPQMMFSVSLTSRKKTFKKYHSPMQSSIAGDMAGLSECNLERENASENICFDCVCECLFRHGGDDENIDEVSSNGGCKDVYVNFWRKKRFPHTFACMWVCVNGATIV